MLQQVKKLAAPLILILALLAAGCGSPSTQSMPPGTGESLSGAITASGSTSVQPLAEELAVAFKVKYPNVNITVGGGGSSAGVKAAQSGTSDIGASSRELTSAEQGTVVETVIAKDAIAVVVHPSLSVTNLTKAQVKDIYAGTVTNWSAVGGPNRAIHVVSREEGSGTRGAFQEIVMGSAQIVASAILQNSGGAVRTTVAGDADAIGYVSLGSIDATVKAISVDGVAASIANTKNGTYPIVRPFLFLTKSQPAGAVKVFIDWILSPEGQAIVAKEYVSVG